MLQAPTPEALGANLIQQRRAIWRAAMMLAGLGFLGCMFGIAARPLGMLSSFWIANGLVAGFLLKVPAFRTWQAGVLSFVAFMAADLLTGASLWPALWLTLSNFAGIGVAVGLLARQNEQVLQLHSERSVVIVASALLAASVAAAIIGVPAGIVFFGMEPLNGAGVWISTEFMNYLLIVPLILSFARQETASRQRMEAIPLIALLGSEIAAILIGGPGAIAFTLPAFLWIALTHSLFNTTLLFTLFCLWKCFVFAMGLDGASSEVFGDIASLRLGLSLLWLGPLSVACSHAAKLEMLRKLDHASQHDLLTQVLVRAAFMRQGVRLLDRLRQEQQPLAVLMLDIDHFKQVNDRYGHAMGDEVLADFAQAIKGTLRSSDMVARMGGEEFAILLPRLHATEAEAIAERLLKAVRALSFHHAEQNIHFAITCSLGMQHYASDCLPTALEQALGRADDLLYQAKHGGRDQAVTHSEEALHAAMP